MSIKTGKVRSLLFILPGTIFEHDVLSGDGLTIDYRIQYRYLGAGDYRIGAHFSETAT
jgi:hypothetical protein